MPAEGRLYKPKYKSAVYGNLTNSILISNKYFISKAQKFSFSLITSAKNKIITKSITFVTQNITAQDIDFFSNYKYDRLVPTEYNPLYIYLAGQVR